MFLANEMEKLKGLFISFRIQTKYWIRSELQEGYF